MLFLSRETLDITNKEILYAVSWHLWRDFHFRWRTFGKHSDTKIKVRCDEGNLKSFEELFLFMRLNRILSLKSCKVKSNIQESLKSCERRNEEHQRNITMIDDFSSWNIHSIVCLLQAELATGELSLPPSSPEYSLCEPCGLWRISGGGVTGWLHHTGLVRWYVETGGERGSREAPDSVMSDCTHRHDCNHVECFTSPITVSPNNQQHIDFLSTVLTMWHQCVRP